MLIWAAFFFAANDFTFAGIATVFFLILPEWNCHLCISYMVCRFCISYVFYRLWIVVCLLSPLYCRMCFVACAWSYVFWRMCISFAFCRQCLDVCALPCALSYVFCCIVYCRIYFVACAFRMCFVACALSCVFCRLCVVACILSPVHFECVLPHVHFESVLSPVHCRMSFLARGGSQSRSLIGVVPGHPLVSARHCFRRRLHDSIAGQASWYCNPLPPIPPLPLLLLLLLILLLHFQTNDNSGSVYLKIDKLNHIFSRTSTPINHYYEHNTLWTFKNYQNDYTIHATLLHSEIQKARTRSK